MRLSLLTVFRFNAGINAGINAGAMLARCWRDAGINAGAMLALDEYTVPRRVLFNESI